MANPTVPNVTVFLDILHIEDVRPAQNSPMLNLAVDKDDWLAHLQKSKTSRASSIRTKNVSIPSQYTFDYNDCDITVTHSTEGFFRLAHILTFSMNGREFMRLSDSSDEYKYFLYTLFEQYNGGNFKFLSEGRLVLRNQRVELQTASSTNVEGLLLPDVNRIQISDEYSWTSPPLRGVIWPSYVYKLSNVRCPLRLTLATISKVMFTVGRPSGFSFALFQFDDESPQSSETSMVQNFVNLELNHVPRSPVIKPTNDRTPQVPAPTEPITGKKRSRSPPRMTIKPGRPVEASNIFRMTPTGPILSRVPTTRVALTRPQSVVPNIARSGPRINSPLAMFVAQSRSMRPEGTLEPSNLFGTLPVEPPTSGETRIRSIQTPSGTRVYLTRR